MLTFDVPGARRSDGQMLAVGDAYSREADAARTRVVSGDPSLAIDAVAYWINTGRPRPFGIGPSPDSALSVNVLNTLAGLLWDGDTAAAVRSAGELSRRSAASKDTTYSLMGSAAYLTLGLWALNHGDTAAVERARTGLRALRVPSATPWLIATPEIHESSCAHPAVARKTPDMHVDLGRA
jgi:hypothetical protein